MSASMNILLCHNYYRHPGGEDRVFSDEAQLLEERGHRVIRLKRHNASIDDMSSMGLAARVVWNQQVYDEVRTLIRRERPAVMHCTNTFPLISPSVYYAARAEGVAVVQSLHNYRMVCPESTFFRKGRICRQCLGKTVPWPAVVHGCYRHGRASNAVIATMSGLHRAVRTWKRVVDRYIALSEFARRIFIVGGVPAEKMIVTPNFVLSDPGPGAGSGGYGIFVGRVSAEKGVRVLLDAWAKLSAKVPLKIVGDGELAPAVRAAAARDDRIEWCGWQSIDKVHALLGNAAFLVLPSVTYEMLPRTIIEAYASGTPVIASDHGGMADLVTPGVTGELFRPGDQDELAAVVTRLMGNARGLHDRRRGARAEFDAKYTSAHAYARLLRIYEEAIAARVSRRTRSRAANAEHEGAKLDARAPAGPV